MPEIGELMRPMVQRLRLTADLLDARSRARLSDELKNRLVAVGLEAQRRYGPSDEFGYQAAIDFVDAVMDQQTEPDAQLFLTSSGKFVSFLVHKPLTSVVIFLAAASAVSSVTYGYETWHKNNLDLEVDRWAVAEQASWSPTINSIYQSVESTGHVAELVSGPMEREVIADTKSDGSAAGGLKTFITGAVHDRILGRLKPEFLGQKYMDEYGPEGLNVTLDGGNMTALFVGNPNSASKTILKAVEAKARLNDSIIKRANYVGLITSQWKLLKDWRNNPKKGLSPWQYAFYIAFTDWRKVWYVTCGVGGLLFSAVRYLSGDLLRIVHPKAEEKKTLEGEQRLNALEFKIDQILDLHNRVIEGSLMARQSLSAIDSARPPPQLRIK